MVRLDWFMVFNVTFNNIVVVGFIGGGNWRTPRKPLTCRKSLTDFYHIMLYPVHLTWVRFELKTLVVINTNCIGRFNPIINIHNHDEPRQINMVYAIFSTNIINWLCLTSLPAISWRPVLVVEEAGVPGENHRPWASNC